MIDEQQLRQYLLDREQRAAVKTMSADEIAQALVTMPAPMRARLVQAIESRSAERIGHVLLAVLDASQREAAAGRVQQLLSRNSIPVSVVLEVINGLRPG